MPTIQQPVFTPSRAEPSIDGRRDLRAKRLFDIVIASVLLIFCLPTLLMVAVAIWIETGGPVFFTQERTGFGGRVFRILKFRSMVHSACAKPVIQAVRGDARVTRVGAFIRRTNLDELPQLVNVLRGEMSLVGPRPHALAHDDYYGRRVGDYDRRFAVLPGMTGLAQVSGCRGETPTVAHMAARVAHDLEYVRAGDIGMDLKILVRTLMRTARDPAAF